MVRVSPALKAAEQIEGHILLTEGLPTEGCARPRGVWGPGGRPVWPEQGRAHATEETWKLSRTLGDPKGSGSHGRTWSRDVTWPTGAGKDGRCANRLGGNREGSGTGSR